MGCQLGTGGWCACIPCEFATGGGPARHWTLPIMAQPLASAARKCMHFLSVPCDALAGCNISRVAWLGGGGHLPHRLKVKCFVHQWAWRTMTLGPSDEGRLQARQARYSCSCRPQGHSQWREYRCRASSPDVRTDTPALTAVQLKDSGLGAHLHLLLGFSICRQLGRCTLQDNPEHAAARFGCEQPLKLNP